MHVPFSLARGGRQAKAAVQLHEAQQAASREPEAVKAMSSPGSPGPGEWL